MKKENYIIPLTLELNKHIEKKVYFLSMPGILKEKLMRLEELSRNGQGTRGRFIREKHNLPLNSLKKLFVSYLTGVTDMKAVNYFSDDKRWLISCEPIQVELVIKIIKIWIDAFYIAETELDKKRGNDHRVKEYAEQIIHEINVEMFAESACEENLVLFDKGEVVDKDAYSLLPLFVINELVGTTVTVNGEQARWMYSKKNEIATDPLMFKDEKEEDAFSYVARFSVQTLPPYSKTYLNVKISSRRWVSRNESEKVPFYTDEKSVYVRINDNKLQVIYAKYDTELKGFEWVYKDKKSFCGMYGTKNVVSFQDIICNPSKYMKGIEQNDFYVTFEYGMKDGKNQMHNQDAGISTMDRREVFEDIEEKLVEFSDGSKNAVSVSGNDTIAQSYFDKYFVLERKKALDEKFRECVNTICGMERQRIEVCYSAGQEKLRNELMEKLQEHFADTRVEISAVFMDELAEPLICSDEKKRDNLEGYHARIKEIKEKLGESNGNTISIVIIHVPEYYKLSEKVDQRVDPKKALRVGFANTGRLTQFITFEDYVLKEKKRLKAIENRESRKKEIDKPNAFNMNIRNTLLDTYRQLGIHNYLVESKKKTTLQNKVAVGIHVINYKNLMDDIAITPFPIVVSCDLVNHKITVETELSILSKLANKKESVEQISCEYKEFPIRFRNMISKIGKGKRIIPSERFLYDWFEELSDDKKYEIMIAADGTSRKIIKGITNKEIKEVYDAQSGYVSKVGIDGKYGFEIDLEEYDNIDLLRIRVNDEVPDYISNPNDEKQTFEESSGVYKFESVYYSKEVRTGFEMKNIKQNTSKLEDDGAFTHRNIIEIFPMYVNHCEKELDCVRDIHNLRSASVQYEAGKTILPMPLHLAKLLEEYVI